MPILPRLLTILAAATPLVAVEGNMIGNQSHNEGLRGVPAPEGGVTIDGSLAEWDTSGRIWVFADSTIRSRYSTEVSAMYDADHLYLGVKWRDPTPMYSTVDPRFDPGSGWKADSMQVRVDAGDSACWLTTWYFAPEQMPVLHIATWQDYGNSRKGQDTAILQAKPGGTELGQGAEMAYKADADGTGYVQELKIPWALITKREMQAGESIKTGFEFLWGDPTGNTWPIHRYADNLQPGHTSREFFWTAKKSWGQLDLLDHGDLEPLKYVNASFKPEGTIPITLAVPADAARFTVAIEDGSGKRIRNLVGDTDPIDYEVSADGDTRQVEVLWDGLDDDGNPVLAGTYQVRGLSHRGIGITYQQTFYNPGTPPWPVKGGTGSWGSDHATLHLAARAGDMVILAASMAEGGSALLGIGPDGEKKWGDKRGAIALAADETYVYALSKGHMVDGHRQIMMRLNAKDGAYVPFVLDGEERPFLIGLDQLLGAEEELHPHDLAAGGGRLLVALDDRVVVMDAASGAPTGEHALSGVRHIALDGDRCVAWTDHGAKVLDLASGAVSELSIPTLDEVADLALDADGNIALLDAGDRQVKAFTPEGKPAYTCGTEGGRAIRGAWQPGAMAAGSSLAVDAAGKLWVTERGEYPRRVSVWNRDGELVRDYIGNTGYAGTGCFLHDQDPTLAYVGPIELKLNEAERSWSVNKILWVPDESKGEGFPIPTRTHSHPSRFRSEASGETREYLHKIGYRTHHGHVVYMEGSDGDWRPVAAITTAGQVGDLEDPASPVNGMTDKQPLVWNDTNADGVVQKDEFTTFPKLPMGNDWGTRLDPATMTIYAFGEYEGKSKGLYAWAPTGFADNGAPIYGIEGLKDLGVEDHGDLVPVPGTDRLLVHSKKGYAGPTRLASVDIDDGSTQWSYPNPFPGVHGSHRATMARPGLLIGGLKILGLVPMDDEIGTIFAIRGNLGQDFYFTTDGLMVGAVFQDCRLPRGTLPDKEENLIGVPMEGFSNGGEPFNGWLGRHDDGQVRLTTGLPRQAAMIHHVSGLDSIARYEPFALEVTTQQLEEALKANAERAAEGGSTTAYTVTKVAAKPDQKGWEALPAMTIARAGLRDGAKVRLAYDDDTLYARFEVSETTPWQNEGKDQVRLFKTGDAVDLQFGPVGADRRAPEAGDSRVLISQLKDGRKSKPVAVLMRPVDDSASEDQAYTYVSPVAPKSFDRVEVLGKEAQLKVWTEAGIGYTVEASLPLDVIGMDVKSGTTLGGDVGIILSDGSGQINTARLYWVNQQTNLVNDEPQEAWFKPAAWGTFTFE